MDSDSNIDGQAGTLVVSSYSRIRRQQLIQEAEGYLDLAMFFADQWPLDQTKRDRLAERALEALGDMPTDQGQDAHSLYLRGLAYRIMRRYHEAIPPLKTAGEIDPENIHVNLAIAWCYKRVGRIDLAIQALEEALEVNAAEGILYYNLACYWSLANHVGLALAYLAKAFELDSNYRDRVVEEPDFEPLRDHPEFQSLLSGVIV
jgi:tetratricopeptide (TPR) repeat protein